MKNLSVNTVNSSGGYKPESQKDTLKSAKVLLENIDVNEANALTKSFSTFAEIVSKEKKVTKELFNRSVDLAQKIQAEVSKLIQKQTELENRLIQYEQYTKESKELTNAKKLPIVPNQRPSNSIDKDETQEITQSSSLINGHQDLFSRKLFCVGLSALVVHTFQEILINLPLQMAVGFCLYLVIEKIVTQLIKVVEPLKNILYQAITKITTFGIEFFKTCLNFSKERILQVINFVYKCATGLFSFLFTSGHKLVEFVITCGSKLFSVLKTCFTFCYEKGNAFAQKIADFEWGFAKLIFRKVVILPLLFVSALHYFKPELMTAYILNLVTQFIKDDGIGVFLKNFFDSPLGEYGSYILLGLLGLGAMKTFTNAVSTQYHEYYPEKKVQQ